MKKKRLWLLIKVANISNLGPMRAPYWVLMPIDEEECRLMIRRIQRAGRLRQENTDFLQLEYFDHGLTWLTASLEDSGLHNMLTGAYLQSNLVFADEARVVLLRDAPVYQQDDEAPGMECVSRKDQHDGCLWEGLLVNSDCRAETAAVPLDTWKRILKIITKVRL
jgi:hypothetical protein